MDDPTHLRREGERLVAKGQAMIDRAAHIEAARALGEEPEAGRGSVVWHSGITAVARELAEEGWTTAQALAERTGHKVANASACLSTLARNGELEKRKTAGYPTEYRKAGLS